MLIDEIQIVVKGGEGGRGKVSFGKMLKSGPDGGNGGDGGDLYFEAISDLTLLNQFSEKQEFQAENGIPGNKVKMAGRKGIDTTIYIPVGTTVKDLESGEEWELDRIHQRLLICKGGVGGKGNWEFRSPTNTTPKYAQNGEKGQVRNIYLILKFIADFGLIGLPNSGKSSLLAELTNAKPKIADYAFTTLTPNLGVMENGKVLVDIPGLIEGAHEGKGLGIRFLKHIEKVKLLLHCISADSVNVLSDYKAIRNELKSYNKSLLEKPEIILLTKSDLVDKKELEKKIKKISKLNPQVISVSIHDLDSLELLRLKL